MNQEHSSEWRIERPPRPNRWSSRSRDTIIGHSALAVGNPGTKLARGWQWAMLVDIAAMESGHTPSRSRADWWGGDVAWIGIKDARKHHGGVIRETAQFTNNEGLANSAARLLPAGTVCISRTASIGYVVEMGHPMATSQDFVNWVPTAAVMSSWLRTLFNCGRATLVKFGKGSTHTTIYYPEWMSVHIALPPIVEQRAIFAKIESLFSELDQGVAQLEAVQEQLKRYRQSVLKAAFEGRLTAEWREQRKSEAEAAGEMLPTAADLLEQIEAERKAVCAQRVADWEQAVAVWEAAGGKGSGEKKPRKPVNPKETPPLAADELEKLADVPEGWVWVRLFCIVDAINGNTPKGIESCTGKEIDFYRISDMNRDGNELWMKSSASSFSREEASRISVRIAPEGTIIFPKRGGAIATNKKRRLSKPAAFDLNTMGVTAAVTVLDPEFLWHWIVQLDLRTLGDGSNVPQINEKDIRPLLFSIAPLGEQLEIVSEIDARLSVIDQVEQAITNALKQATALRHSILKQAFEGRLLTEDELAAVRADPDYEPADQLLARIKAAREKTPVKKKPRRKAASKKTTKESA